MNTILSFAIIAFLLIPPGQPGAQISQVKIADPQAGRILSGTVAVTGTSSVDGFQSAEVSFAYSNYSSSTWFRISQSTQPVVDGILATWDTTTVTDGNYSLRLQVILIDGSSLDVIVSDLQIRNVSPANTATLTATPIPSVTPTSTATPRPTETELPTATMNIPPTGLSENPAALPVKDAWKSILFGGLAVAVGVLLLTVLFGIRNKKE